MQIKHTVLVISIFIIATYNIALSNGEVKKNFLQIKKVIVSQEVVNDDKYINGEDKYPEFKNFFKSKK